MTNINIIQVSAPKCHPQRIHQIKGTQNQNVHLRMHCIHWNDCSIKNVKYLKL